jgi:hypothetical protein
VGYKLGWSEARPGGERGGYAGVLVHQWWGICLSYVSSGRGGCSMRPCACKGLHGLVQGQVSRPSVGAGSSMLWQRW